MTSEASPGWFRRHFNDDYRIIYRGRDRAQAEMEAAGIVRELRIAPGDRVLDLCCGYGRHLAALDHLGIDAVGVDLSRQLLAQVERGCRRRVVCADMLSLPFPGNPGAFQVVLNFFTSFGYFDTDAENLQAAREICRVLAPGGRFALDLMNPAPIVESLLPSSERRAGSFVVRERRAHDPSRHRIEKAIELVDERTGSTRRYFESVRLFSPHEIAALLGSAGLRVERFLGDFHGGVYGPRAERMIVLGKRPE